MSRIEPMEYGFCAGVHHLDIKDLGWDYYLVYAFDTLEDAVDWFVPYSGANEDDTVYLESVDGYWCWLFRQF